MTEDESTRLDAWLRTLQANGEVVVFCPTAPAGEKGFYYVPSEARDHDDASLPIRNQLVLPGAIGYFITREGGANG